MTVGELKAILADLDDDLTITVRDLNETLSEVQSWDYDRLGGNFFFDIEEEFSGTF